MTRIAWYGTGLMGSGFVEALRKRGVEVTVYNRTAEKALALERFGARAVNDPREAARGATQIHIMLADDATVDELLERLNGAIEPGTIVIDHTTVAPGPTRKRFERMAERGIAFLHAPVFMSPQACRDGVGVMLVAGPQDVFDKVRASLQPMTGDLWYTGERPDKAATLKLFGNEILIALVAGLADGYALATSAGLRPEEAYELFSHFKPTVALETRGKTMAAGNFKASFELSMARKDVRLMIETAAAGGVPVHFLPGIATRMDELLAAGHAADDLSVLGVDTVAAAVS
jgi:3-hydroxyisobutyrate dehydrogenase-like beta-hydroxyacid dehydrogenase